MTFYEEDQLRRVIREELRLALGEAYAGKPCEHEWSGKLYGTTHEMTCLKCGAWRKETRST